MTERELSTASRYRRFARENSGISLTLEWRVHARNAEPYVEPNRWGVPEWFDRAKLVELGFDLDGAGLGPDARTGERYRALRRLGSREVFVVLEYDGPAWQRAREAARADYEAKQRASDDAPDDERLARVAENASRQSLREQHEISRLFAVDAGVDGAALREQYSDRDRYVITRALVRPNASWDEDREPVFGGMIQQLLVPNLHVDASHRGLFERLENNGRSSVAVAARRGTGQSRPPRYQVRLAWGQRFEPWILDIETMDSTTDEQVPGRGPRPD